MARVRSELAPAAGSGMGDDLIGVGGAALNHRAIAVRLELLAGRVFRTAQRSQKFVLIPGAQQDVITPLGVRVRDPVIFQLRILFDGRGAGNITEPTGVGAADGDIE
jgi:hypothetical protein